MKKHDKIFTIISIIIILAVIFGIVKLEIDVQRRWDKYEQTVFMEVER